MRGVWVAWCLCLLLLLLWIGAASASCWSAVGYHAAASALATGLGDMSSSAVCVYSAKVNSSATNAECPPPCKALLAAAWGDCYCRDPAYQPLSWGADKLVYNLTVAQMFLLVGTPRYTAAEVEEAVAPLRARIAELEAQFKTEN